MYLSLSPLLYVVNEGGKGEQPLASLRGRKACKYTPACEHASMSSPEVLVAYKLPLAANISPSASLYSASYAPYILLPLSVVIR
jgi:hypothetical protein